MDLSGLTFTDFELTAKNAENAKGSATPADGAIRGCVGGFWKDQL